MDVKLLNGNVLAYLGDSYYEHQIRSYLINTGLTKLNDLHKQAIKYTSGKAQAKIITSLLANEVLNQEELNIYKRGRNITVKNKKHLNISEVNASNGFEALIGYLSVKDTKKAQSIIEYAITYIEETNGK